MNFKSTSEREKTLSAASRQIRQCFLQYVLIVCLAGSAFAAPQWKLRLQADQAYRSQDYKTAMTKYLKVANEKGGDRYAECQVGIMYANGQGVQQDYAIAAKWYELAARHGNAFAAYDLGWLYLNAQGLPQDYAKAMEWFGRAAGQGHAIAALNLGILYRDGHGTLPDLTQAAKWFQFAAGSGVTDANHFLADLYREGGEAFPQDFGQAARHYRVSVEAMISNSQDNGYLHSDESALGYLYQNGRGVPQDFVEAAKWFRLAAEGDDTGSRSAQDSLRDLERQMRPDEVSEARGLAATFVKDLQAKAAAEPQSAEQQPAEEAAADDSQGPNYFDYVNKNLQTIIDRQNATISAAQARRKFQ